MRHLTTLKKFVSLTAIASFLALPFPTGATGTTYAQDTDLTVAGVALRIMAGSQADGITTQADGITVTVAADEAFIVRAVGPFPAVLENDGLLATCKVTKNRDNQMLVFGPKTVTIRPSATACSTANYDTDTTPFLALSTPAAAATVKSGDAVQLFWQTTGTGAASIRIRLSTDGGLSYPTTIAENLINSGFYNWTVPTIVTTQNARLKLEGWNNARIDSIAVGPAFTIQGTEPPPAAPSGPSGSTPAATYDYDSVIATAEAASIDDDLDLPVAMYAPGTFTCASGSRIKGASSSAVYYCGRDGKRHAFPNQKIHDTWYQGFAGVITLSDADLAKVQLGRNVRYRPGIRMIKLQTDPNVYAVAKGGVLRWLPDEWTAKAVYGDDWNTKIDDVSDAFFVDYALGERVRQQ